MGEITVTVTETFTSQMWLAAQGAGLIEREDPPDPAVRGASTLCEHSVYRSLRVAHEDATKGNPGDALIMDWSD